MSKKFSCVSAHAYLFYDGDTEEAFNFYKEVFSTDFDEGGIKKYSDMPGSEDNALSAEDANKVMHVSMHIAPHFYIMGSDILRSAGQDLRLGNTTHITLVPSDLDEAQRIYTELSKGGEILVPLEKSFWNSYFAHFTDRWGIHWMIDIASN